MGLKVPGGMGKLEDPKLLEINQQLGANSQTAAEIVAERLALS